jgi:competence protein ComFC
MRNLWRTFLEILFPQSELTAHVEELAINYDLRTLPEAEKVIDPWMHALFAYRNRFVRTIVWQTKYQANSTLIESVASLLSEEITALLEEKTLFTGNSWLLIPIPASNTHKKAKGFNQTELLCRAIMQKIPTSFSYEPSILNKTRETKLQTSVKDKKEREQNVEHSMTATSSVKGKNIILIDDVITTGSTLREAKRALKEVGAKEIFAFAIAH